MKRLSLPIAMVLGLILVTPTFGATTAFTGEWIGTDPAPPDGDGSTVHLYVTGGTHAKLTLTDEFGTVCVLAESEETFFTSTLVGVVSGDTLDATIVAARCGTVPLKFLQGSSLSFELDDQGNANPADDTLSDGSVDWQRV